jgi:hypothetical protein
LIPDPLGIDGHSRMKPAGCYSCYSAFLVFAHTDPPKLPQALISFRLPDNKQPPEQVFIKKRKLSRLV